MNSFTLKTCITCGSPNAANSVLCANCHLDVDFGAAHLEGIPLRVLSEALDRSEEEQFALPPRSKTAVLIPSVTAVLQLLRGDFTRIYELTPEELELLVCERLEALGYACQRTGPIHKRDGGIDILAIPESQAPHPFLLAVQVKHHRQPSRTTGVANVRDFVGALASQRFLSAGMIVTSTTFSPNARWLADQAPKIVQLRDFRDLRRWIDTGFLASEDYRELPDRLQIGPHCIVRVPR